jgi:hypothetical protein
MIMDRKVKLTGHIFAILHCKHTMLFTAINIKLTFSKEEDVTAHTLLLFTTAALHGDPFEQYRSLPCHNQKMGRKLGVQNL